MWRNIWTKQHRKLFIISFWHILEYTKKYRDYYKVDWILKSKIANKFSLPLNEITIRLERAVNNGWLRKKGNSYCLSKKSINFLEQNNLYSFLQSENPLLKNAKIRAKKLNKSFREVLDI